MHKHTGTLAVHSVLLFLGLIAAAACGSSSGAADAGVADRAQAVDQPRPDTQPWPKLGESCAGGLTCAQGTCALSCPDDPNCPKDVCTKACASSADCPQGFDCRALGSVTICVAQRYQNGADYGKSCAVVGKQACPEGMDCAQSAPDDPDAFCTTSCKDDLDCPPPFYCLPSRDGSSMCVRRDFCAPCSLDEECAGGHCIAGTDGKKYCTSECVQEGKSCHDFATCKEGSGGQLVCQHKAGVCVGTGAVCDPCRSDLDCAEGGYCLQLIFSKERFCSAPCKTGNKCDRPYRCVDIGASTPQCVPPVVNDHMTCF